eukprot:gene10933-14677_t
MFSYIIKSSVCFYFLITIVTSTSSNDDHICSLCISVLDFGAKTSNLQTKTGPIDINSICKDIFTDDACQSLKLYPESMSTYNPNYSSRVNCEKLAFCPIENKTYLYNQFASDDNNIDVRVTKALGNKGYNKIRLTAISNQTLKSDYFSYTSQFKYRWTSKYLSTGIVDVIPGETSKFDLFGKNIEINLPLQGAGVRGVILADPCFQSEWINCLYKDEFQMFNHTIELLNAMFVHDDMHYWQILGDNFYDQAGDASSAWFEALATTTKSKFFTSTPGNHDFWVNGSPTVWTEKDQQGNGFMQFYGQDTIASTLQNDNTPFDFTVDPDGDAKGAHNLPPASNYFLYNQVGNVAFIGFSGAHSLSSMKSYFVEACTWASDVKADAILIVGHWSSPTDGCSEETSVPAIYREIIEYPECAPLESKMRYFYGHKHCNIITSKDKGFMVGGQGMSDATSCGGNFGIPIVDTTGGRFKVYYFPIASHSEGLDNYQSILDCVTANGISGCYHLATVWSDQAI